jgi:hypothetical protein
LARHESSFGAKAQEPLTLNELLDLLGDGAVSGDRSREDAIACYLSGADGWKDAVKRLGGAFADGAAGLKERKAD